MARLAWGTPGERFFEAGIDRGVLYLTGQPGVPWNGLTAVQESPSGGEPTPYYVDGFKYLNVASAEEFAATINAFSAPSEFKQCEGAAELFPGLIVTQQPKQQFGLSYRTRIGNDISGLDHGYKIHLVYKALAVVASKDRKTLGSVVTPMDQSWSITTLPMIIPGVRPSAHMVIDSTKTPGYILNHIEDALYGSFGTDPYLPTPIQLMDMFNIAPPVGVFSEIFEETF